MDSQRTTIEIRNQDDTPQYCVCANSQPSSARISTPTAATGASGHLAARLLSGDNLETPQTLPRLRQARQNERVDSSSDNAPSVADSVDDLVVWLNGLQLGADDGTIRPPEPFPHFLESLMAAAAAAAVQGDSSSVLARPAAENSGIDIAERLNRLHMQSALVLSMSVERQLGIADSSERPDVAAENAMRAHQHLPMALRALSGHTMQQSTAPDARNASDPESDSSKLCPTCHRYMGSTAASNLRRQQ